MKEKSVFALAILAVIFMIGAVVVSNVDAANATTDSPVYDERTIRLDAEGLDGSTITVSVHDHIIIEDGYESWRGGWLNTLYEKFYLLGRINASALVNIPNVFVEYMPNINEFTETVGSHIVDCYTETIDHGVVLNKSYQYRSFSFTLNVVDDLSITYKSNTADFTYDWVESIPAGSSLMVREVSNTVAGKDFVGWNNKANGTGTWYQPLDLISSGHTTLYAQWRDSIAVTSPNEVTVDKGGNINYKFTFSQSNCSVSQVDSGQLDLNLSNGRITGVVDASPGKYTLKFQVTKGDDQSIDFFLNVYVRIQQIEAIDEMAFSGEGWIRSIELMPSNVSYDLIYGTITRTIGDDTETISAATAGLNSPSGLMVSGLFTQAGTYVINITASAPNNPELKSTNIVINLLVEDPIPSIADPTIEKTIVSKTPVFDTYHFIVIDPKDYAQIIWHFGDGTSSTGHSVVHHYNYPGNYQWTLTLKAQPGYDDAVYTGYVISLGQEEMPVDAWIGTRYATMIEAPSNAIFTGPAFCTSSIITDSVTGKTYILISGTPDESWADRTGKSYLAMVKVEETVISSWSIAIHGSANEVIESAFNVKVVDHTVSVEYLGSSNAVIYIAWDGINYTRIPGMSASHDCSNFGSYAIPITIVLGDTQLSTSISFNIVEPGSSLVHINKINDRAGVVGEDISIPLIVSPYNSTITITGADWLSFANGKISGTPDSSGIYTISVFATSGSDVSKTQTFTITISDDIPVIDSSVDYEIVYLLAILYGILLVFIVLTRDLRVFGISMVIAITALLAACI